MKKTLGLIIGLALAASAFTVSAQQAPGRGQGGPANRPCDIGQSGGGGADCPYYGYCPGQGQGQQKRHGWGQGQGQGQGQQKRHGWGQGQGQGQGKGFRGGPRDGSGPRRDGTGGQCPNKA